MLSIAEMLQKLINDKNNAKDYNFVSNMGMILFSSARVCNTLEANKHYIDFLEGVITARDLGFKLFAEVVDVPESDCICSVEDLDELKELLVDRLASGLISGESYLKAYEELIQFEKCRCKSIGNGEVSIPC